MVRVMPVGTTVVSVVVMLTLNLVHHLNSEKTMRRFISLLQILFVVLGVSLLSGCAYMTDVSNKNPDIQQTPVGLKASEPKSVCKNWCHNGWCSTHCENSASAAKN
jgi:hypothetical protein